MPASLAITETPAAGTASGNHELPEGTTAALMLASGSRRGIRAPLLNGYYLIGRDGECQIRPKSRSVSRRHCLIENRSGKLRLLDLRSTSGTHLNGERVRPESWFELKDSDEIRLGKICFGVQVLATEPVSTRPETSPSRTISNPEGAAGSPSDIATKSDIAADAGQPSTTAASMTTTAASVMRTGVAMSEEDIADFLGDADRHDQEARYASIRGEVLGDGSQAFAEDAEATIVQDPPGIAIENSVDDEGFFDDDLIPAATIQTGVSENDGSGPRGEGEPTTPNSSASEAESRARKDKWARRKGEKRKPEKTRAEKKHSKHAGGKPRRTKPAASKKTSRPKRIATPSLSLGGGWKPAAAMVLLVAALSALGYQVIQAVSGPEVRVLRSLD